MRGGAGRLRVTAHLIDATNGSHLWAERFDRRAEDLFEIQDEITKEVVTSLRVQLTDGEQARTWARGTSDIEAWHLGVQAIEAYFRYDATGYLEARQLAERALAVDPSYTLAAAVLGFSHWWEGRLGFTGNPMPLFARAREIADAAMRDDDSHS